MGSLRRWEEKSEEKRAAGLRRRAQTATVLPVDQPASPAKRVSPASLCQPQITQTPLRQPPKILGRSAESFPGDDMPGTWFGDWAHLQPEDVRQLVGISLAVGGNLLVSIALNVTKYAHNVNQRAVSPKPYVRLPLWWLGFAATLVGELGNFSAYGFAEASVIAPLGAVSVLANAFIAAFVLGEGLRFRDLFGCALCVFGGVFIVCSSSSHPVDPDPDHFLASVQDRGLSRAGRAGPATSCCSASAFRLSHGRSRSERCVVRPLRPHVRRSLLRTIRAPLRATRHAAPPTPGKSHAARVPGRRTASSCFTWRASRS